MYRVVIQPKDQSIKSENIETPMCKLQGIVHLLHSSCKYPLPHKFKSKSLLIINAQEWMHEYLQKYKQIETIVVSMYQKVCKKERTFIILKCQSQQISEQIFNTLEQKHFLVLYLQNISFWPSEQRQPEWLQLPTCPKCLSSIDLELTGLSPPQPTMSQIPKISPCDACESRTHPAKCLHCGQSQDNWACLICGQVNCGRYKKGHAYNHYIRTKHDFSLDLKTGIIWSYQKDCFSHRVNKVQGIMDQGGDDAQVQEIFWKYSSVLSEVLDRQRMFYLRVGEGDRKRVEAQIQALDSKIQDLTKIRDQKKQQLKKKSKKLKKTLRREKQLQEQRDQERQICKCLEETANTPPNQEMERLIEQKKKELEQIESKIQQVLITLSQN